MTTVKEQARLLVDQLGDSATWDDLIYEIYVRQKIEAGLEAAGKGQVVPHEEVRSRFLRR